MKKLLIDTPAGGAPHQRYPLFLGHHSVLSNIDRLLKDITPQRNLIFVTSPNVHKLFWEKIKNSFQKEWTISKIVVSDAERHKTLKSVNTLISKLLKFGADRKTILVAVGGGMIGDLAGFAASIYMRGLPHIVIPTTLLSSIDSSIGGKCGVNLPIGKNLIGSFHQPKAVFTDTSLLETLPQREWRSGFAEIIKYAILDGGKLWSLLHRYQIGDFQRSPESLQTLILECLKIKKEFIEKDEKDHGDRKLLNLGHTMAHALEASNAYKKLSHGEAVAQGLYFAADLSVQRKLCSPKTAQKIYNLLKRYDFYRQAIPKQAFSFMKNDKKRVGSKLEWILIEGIGRCRRIPMGAIQKPKVVSE